VNPKIKARWITRLRSGEVPQTSGGLRDAHGQCCLGVLCELAVEDKVIPASEVGDLGFHVYGEGEDQQGGILPNAVVDWAGLPEQDPSVDMDADDEEDVIERSLSDLNDTGWTFAEIADLIEEQL